MTFGCRCAFKHQFILHLLITLFPRYCLANNRSVFFFSLTADEVFRLFAVQKEDVKPQSPSTTREHEEPAAVSIATDKSQDRQLSQEVNKDRNHHKQ